MQVKSLLAVSIAFVSAVFASPIEKRGPGPVIFPIISLYTGEDYTGNSTAVRAGYFYSDCVAFPVGFQNNVSSLAINQGPWACNFYVNADCTDSEGVFSAVGDEGVPAFPNPYFNDNLNAVACTTTNTDRK